MKNVLRKIINVLLIIVLLFAVFLFIVKFTGTANKSNFPVHLYEILTGSMEPTLKKRDEVSTGDVVLVINTKVDKLKVNDIISYYKDVDNDGRIDVITHRLVSIEDGNYTIVGDAEGALEETYTKEELSKILVGKVMFNRKAIVITFLFRFISTTYGFILCIALPLLYLFIRELIVLLSMSKNKEEEEKQDNSLDVTYDGVTYTEEQIKKMIEERENK